MKQENKKIILRARFIALGIFGLVVLAIITLFAIDYYVLEQPKKRSVSEQERDNNIRKEEERKGEEYCKNSKIDFQKPQSEITSAMIGPAGGVLQIKYRDELKDKWIAVKVPAGVLQKDIKITLSLEKSNYIVREGEGSPVTFKIEPDFDIKGPEPLMATVEYQDKFEGCKFLPITYLVDEGTNQLHGTQLTQVDYNQKLFTMDTFHGGRYSWIIANKEE